MAVGFYDFYGTRYTPMVRLARGLVDTSECAEEIVQDAFVKVYERWDRLDEPAGYLRTAVVNGARSELRRREARRRIGLRHRAVSTPAEGDYLIDALDKLPPERRFGPGVGGSVRRLRRISGRQRRRIRHEARQRRRRPDRHLRRRPHLERGALVPARLLVRHPCGRRRSMACGGRRWFLQRGARRLRQPLHDPRDLRGSRVHRDTGRGILRSRGHRIPVTGWPSGSRQHLRLAGVADAEPTEQGSERPQLWVGWSADGTDWGWQSLPDALGSPGANPGPSLPWAAIS